jgi:GNAT superfamily N-acetyltransferase
MAPEDSPVGMSAQPTTLIRTGIREDGASLFHLAAQFATSFTVEEAVFHASLSRLLGDPGACVLVAETEGEAIGCLLGFEHLAFFANGRVAWVEEIMVAETVRRQGIGRHLMDTFSAWARSRQCRLVALATRRAASFYLSIGYEESAAYFRKLL